MINWCSLISGIMTKDELVKMAHFVCFDRDGKLADSKYDIMCMRMPSVPVSSSEIRMGNKLNYLPNNFLVDRKSVV